MRVLLISSVVVVLSACAGSSPSSDAGPPVDDGGAALASACTTSATALCDLYDRCERGGAATLYGSRANCLTVLESQCVTSFHAPGSTRVFSNLTDCATARATESCTALFNNDVPQACRPTGTLADSAGCVFNSQCQSGWCTVPVSGCGSCTSAPTSGTDCSVSSCGQGTQCVDRPVNGVATYSCVAVRTNPGDVCDRYLPCGFGLSCVGALVYADAGVKQEGTCQPAGTDAGVACDPKLRTDAGCEAQAGLFCSAALGDTCQPVTLVATGVECGTLDGGAARNVCSNGDSCFNGTCVAAVAAGASCDVTNGPLCQRPLRCVRADGGTSGTCVALDPSVCQ